MAVEITTDEWLADLERAMQTDDAEGMTMREIAAGMGRSVAVTRLRVRDAAAVDLVEFAGHRRVTRIDGSAGKVPVYRFVRKEDGCAGT